jgi:hypothetical protein
MLDHPHVLRYREVLKLEGQVCLATKFADGGDGASLLRLWSDGVPAE